MWLFHVVVLSNLAKSGKEMNSLKPTDKWKNNEQPNIKQKTNESPAIQKAAESVENISDMKRNQNISNGVPSISLQVVSRKSLQLSTRHASAGHPRQNSHYGKT